MNRQEAWQCNGPKQWSQMSRALSTTCPSSTTTSSLELEARPSQLATRVGRSDRPTIYTDISVVLKALHLHLSHLLTWGRLSRFPSLRCSKTRVPYGKWKRSASVTSCRNKESIRTTLSSHSSCMTYIASEILLLAQDSLITVQLDLESSDKLRHERLVGLFAGERLEQLFVRDRSDNWIELRVLDARSLLEFGERAGFGRH
jgi:hypothetical protein